MDLDHPDPESWARANIRWQHKKQGHRSWVAIAQIHVDGLVFEGRADGPGNLGGIGFDALKRRTEDAAVSDFLDFVSRTSG
jgi:hypothetical protein